MNISKISLLAAAAILTSASLSAQTATRLEATRANDYGIVYSLPQTMVDVTLEAELTVRKPGEFYKYAPKYLNIKDPITKESHSVKLLSASISTHGEPDNEETYTVTFKAGQPVFVALDASGIPLAINTEKLPPRTEAQLPQARDAAPTPLETPAARQVVSEEMLQSQSLAKRAELAAQAIFAIRQTRSDLITGQADNMPPDGKSLQLMLDNLQAQEEALLAMFLGTTSTRTQVEQFTVDPSALADAESSRVIVARLSALDGIVEGDNLSGAPIYLDMKVLTRGELPLNEKGQELSFPKNGIPYRVPGRIEARLTYDGKTYATSTMDISQTGIIYGLAPNSFTDKKSSIYIIYDPATGAILRQGAAN